MRYATPKATFLAAGLLVAAGSAPAPVQLTRKPVMGEITTYSVSGVLTVQGMDMDYKVAKTTDTIVDVAPDGTYKRESKDTGVTVGGAAQPDRDVVTIANKPTGELVSVSGSSSAEMARRLSLTLVYFPDHAVNVGEQWTHTEPKNDALGIQDFKATLKLLGEEKVGDVDTYKVQQDSRETSGDTPPTFHATTWLDAKTGAMVKSETTFKNFMFGTNAISGHLTFVPYTDGATL